jgi:membrane-bound metal-dependent hydrolase YbcI (DUF457 family)
VETLTHALLSLILARASQKHLPRYGAATLVVSGVAADLDYASYLGGPQAFLRFHRILLHSVLGSALLICALACAFWAADRERSARNPDSPQVPLRFASALAVCTFGAATHLLFDLCSGIGVQLLWPFRQKWTAWNVLTNRDPWVLVLLVLGLLLPEVFRLVSEEIGERKKGPRGQLAAVITLLLLLIYLGARAGLHSRAIDQLNARDYNGQPALAAGAYPSSLSPFAWRGLVSTDNAIDTIEMSLAPGAGFDPESAVPHYKPEDSPALGAAQNTLAAKLFLRYARFPLATLEREDDGFQFTLRDLRFESNDNSSDNIVVRVNLNSNLQVTHEEFRYANIVDR